MKNLLLKHKAVIPYMFFGVCTTVVNVLCYSLCEHAGLSVILSTAMAWFLAVLFAYITNRIWVFHSMATTSISILKELFSFFTCRLLTGFLDIAFMYIFVQRLTFNWTIVKITSNIIVIVLNYIFSKLIIFKKRRAS